ncbi:MAG: hypothetical protein M1456_04845 [Actinobacteria bacterium]|jgi:hypothetical protein|nr:hypothetical protein [Actinomycetota bacterium]
MNLIDPGAEVACIDAVSGRFEMLRLDPPLGFHSESPISQDPDNPGSSK